MVAGRACVRGQGWLRQPSGLFAAQSAIRAVQRAVLAADCRRGLHEPASLPAA